MFNFKYLLVKYAKVFQKIIPFLYLSGHVRVHVVDRVIGAAVQEAHHVLVLVVVLVPDHDPAQNRHVVAVHALQKESRNRDRTVDRPQEEMDRRHKINGL